MDHHHHTVDYTTHCYDQHPAHQTYYEPATTYSQPEIHLPHQVYDHTANTTTAHHHAQAIAASSHEHRHPTQEPVPALTSSLGLFGNSKAIATAHQSTATASHHHHHHHHHHRHHQTNESIPPLTYSLELFSNTSDSTATVNNPKGCVPNTEKKEQAKKSTLKPTVGGGCCILM